MTPLTGVGRTALAVAHARARESRRPDRLFDDPYAEVFIAGEPDRPPTAEQSRLGFHAVIRTRFYDEHLLATGHRQVVLLAAGLDTRAYRLDWPPAMDLYELDQPAVLDAKEKVLADATPRCARTTVAVDLREDWATPLTNAGFDPAEPTAWLAEGLLVYLTADEAARLLTTVGGLSAPGSTLACERTTSTERSATGITSLWRGGLGAGTTDWLGEHGWRTEVHGLAELAARYGRPIAGTSRSGFVTAVKVAGSGHCKGL